MNILLISLIDSHIVARFDEVNEPEQKSYVTNAVLLSCCPAALLRRKDWIKKEL